MVRLPRPRFEHRRISELLEGVENHPPSQYQNEVKRQLLTDLRDGAERELALGEKLLVIEQ